MLSYKWFEKKIEKSRPVKNNDKENFYEATWKKIVLIFETFCILKVWFISLLILLLNLKLGSRLSFSENFKNIDIFFSLDFLPPSLTLSYL